MDQQELRNKAKSTIDSLFNKIEELESKIESAGAHRKEEIRKRIEALKQRKAELTGRYEKLLDATGDSFHHIKEAFDESADAFRHHIEEIRERFREKGD